MGFSHGTVVQNLPENAGDIRDEGSITGSGRTPAGGNDNSLQYFCREDSIPRPTAPGITVGQNQAHTYARRELTGMEGFLYIYCGGGYTKLPL